ncbi:hypothetical protein AALO_G00189800 [Alosa alosa]|uniref:Microtubule-associated protein 1B n=1 Tax=Alosa alosa TaxID=278164 RepID=A0AAV6G5U5_9TELE|nr:hypothetical protein AALO_G00189800 [Alosa alosa]
MRMSMRKRRRWNQSILLALCLWHLLTRPSIPLTTLRTVVSMMMTQISLLMSAWELPLTPRPRNPQGTQHQSSNRGRVTSLHHLSTQASSTLAVMRMRIAIGPRRALTNNIHLARVDHNHTIPMATTGTCLEQWQQELLLKKHRQPLLASLYLQQSDSDVPPGTEECPSSEAREANVDSDEDADFLPVDKSSGMAFGGGGYYSSSRSSGKTHDPPPAPMMDPAPHPPHPDVCMVDPEALNLDQNLTEKQQLKKDLKAKSPKKSLGKPKSGSPAGRRKRSPTPAKQTSKDSSPRSTSLKKKDVEKSSRMSRTSDGQGSKEDDMSRSSYNPAKGLVNGVKSSTGSNFSKSSSCGSPIYVDLAYIPNHCSAKNVDQEFFKRVRSAYYVVSGNDPGSEEPSRRVLDALLDGKAQWGSNLQVTLIPTHDTEVMRDWYQQTHERQQELNIMVLASSSTVVMQDESFAACKIEF